MIEAGDYERLLIASLVNNPPEIDTVASVVSERDFECLTLKKAFVLLGAMREAREAIHDSAVLVKKLLPTGLTSAEVFEIATTDTKGLTHYYAKKIAEAGQIRRMRNHLAIINDLFDPEDISATVKRVREVVEDFEAKQSDEFFSLADAGKLLVDELNQRDESSRPSCYSGIFKVDEKIGGFRPGEVIVIAARPGVGKTSLAMQFALHNAKQGRAGLFVSLEMSKVELAGRVFCGLTEVDAKHLRNGSISKDEIDKFIRKIDEVSEMNLFIWDPPGATVHRISAVARLAKIRHDIKFLAVDYVQLIDSAERKSNRSEQVAEITRRLKQLAKELDVPLFMLAQLNREADGATPLLSHLRESGSIEQDADAVIFLHPLGDQKVSFIVAKHRHGERGALTLEFDEKNTTFQSESAGIKWPVG